MHYGRLSKCLLQLFKFSWKNYIFFSFLYEILFKTTSTTTKKPLSRNLKLKCLTLFYGCWLNSHPSYSSHIYLGCQCVWDCGQEMDAPREIAHADGSMQTSLLTRMNVNIKPTHYNESLLKSEQYSLPTETVWLFQGDICIKTD